MSLATDIAVGDPGHAGLHNDERTAINGKPDSFVELDDAPSSLVGEAGKVPVVNGTATALEFEAPAAATVVEANVQAVSAYTLVLADAGKAVEMNVPTANDLTVPPNSSVAFPVGTIIEVLQVGAGQTTIVAGAGVTLRTPSTLNVAGQWGTVSLRQRATDEWVVVGDLS